MVVTADFVVVVMFEAEGHRAGGDVDPVWSLAGLQSHGVWSIMASISSAHSGLPV